MSRLFGQIREAVHRGDYVIGRHANEQLRKRRIAAWQVVGELDHGILLVERPGAEPNPVVEVEQVLADGTEVKAVWAWLRPDRTAKLVTVHFFDGDT